MTEADKAFPDNLTPAERRAADALCQHGMRKVAAARLGIGQATLDSQLSTAFGKAGVHNAIHFVIRYLRATENKT